MLFVLHANILMLESVNLPFQGDAGNIILVICETQYDMSTKYNQNIPKKNHWGKLTMQ